MALDFLGISPGLLTISLVFLSVVLLLIFVFIFLGIEAFGLGGTFGAIINSILPMGNNISLYQQLLEVEQGLLIVREQIKPRMIQSMNQ